MHVCSSMLSNKWRGTCSRGKEGKCVPFLNKCCTKAVTCCCKAVFSCCKALLTSIYVRLSLELSMLSARSPSTTLLPQLLQLFLLLLLLLLLLLSLAFHSEEQGVSEVWARILHHTSGHGGGAAWRFFLSVIHTSSMAVLAVRAVVWF